MDKSPLLIYEAQCLEEEQDFECTIRVTPREQGTWAVITSIAVLYDICRLARRNNTNTSMSSSCDQATFLRRCDFDASNSQDTLYEPTVQIMSQPDLMNQTHGYSVATAFNFHSPVKVPKGVGCLNSACMASREMRKAGSSSDTAERLVNGCL